GLGSYYLWEKRWGFWAWWPMAACLGLAYGLGWYWQRQRKLLAGLEFTPPLHWTDRDHQAWALVEGRAKNAATIDPDQFVGVQLYVDTAKEMALELARAYHPGAADPISTLTIPGLLAVVELAAHDMAV